MVEPALAFKPVTVLIWQYRAQSWRRPQAGRHWLHPRAMEEWRGKPNSGCELVANPFFARLFERYMAPSIQLGRWSHHCSGPSVSMKREGSRSATSHHDLCLALRTGILLRNGVEISPFRIAATICVARSRVCLRLRFGAGVRTISLSLICGLLAFFSRRTISASILSSRIANLSLYIRCR